MVLGKDGKKGGINWQKNKRGNLVKKGRGR